MKRSHAVRIDPNIMLSLCLNQCFIKILEKVRGYYDLLLLSLLLNLLLLYSIEIKGFKTIMGGYGSVDAIVV